MTRKFIIDTDTASDDAVAIMMAVQWPDVQVDALTTVSGNVPLAQCSINARYTLEVCDADVPVYDGCARPLLREPAHAQWFHGPDGMGGMNYPSPKAAPADGHAVDELIRRFGAEPGAITLVTLGPLTNIALALRREPRLAEWVQECYVMGGAANTVGNVTPAAEYNIWCDPEAARIVFHSGMKITMIGWELCCDDAALDDAEIQHVYNLGTERAKVAMDCNMYALNVVRDLQKQPGLALADPVAMAVALDKTVATKRSTHYVDVSCEGLTRGMTVVDQLDITRTPPYSDPHWADKTPNIEVCWALDVARWKEMLYRTLQ